ncbi:MAG: type I-E CRISPR-associated protein Cas6/Cse3/CasE [Methylobacter sp.]|nr:type I-E CRISPR-associated protein Cas6/Cse3/CasE [Methylobacter sp.]MDP2430213.1 type I-E CRISPR-associated protein Cas6/Cse3/CasE [Methylobacter sp.]MDP3053301.1 type I-E CRISPR-associated protein Cas6/Cse3/CasE [Methylobacter sp.]MDP3361961.1 type I-E CRISPR-associated protein Cas6/Cse3/CasE [Methylobacter sp.]MDZ4219088.1 type I-E CRISPR-associated protein Cas6/Cse3/CasE [Methylobacter sp.]
MYLSRVNVLAEQPDQLAKILKADHYELHRLLWRLFPEHKERDFLFRRDESKGFPVFYLQSSIKPSPLAGILAVESKEFNPQLKTGDRLRFTLRANAANKSKVVEGHKANLAQYARRDVVVHLKKTLLDQGIAQEDLPDQAELEQQAGETWLEKKAEKNGFKVLSVIADGYQQHHFKKRGIKISTLDFQGVLEVIEPELFIRDALYKGIDPAKAFGCGLLSLARI